MTNVANNSLVSHFSHMFSHDDSFVSCGGNIDFCSWKNFFKTKNFESSHASLKSADRINFGDNNTCSLCSQSFSGTLTDLSITANNSLFTSKHNISSSHDTINQRVSATINVIEFTLGNTIVNVQSREQQLLVSHHLIKSVDTSGGFFRNSLDVWNNSMPVVLSFLFLNAFQQSVNASNFRVFIFFKDGRIFFSSITTVDQ
mmetsp:Transcript_11469/g.14181  ORF Transcript_11469/g.14181 Transcript_11469/m.14181 type:complete len:201 (-) Transcript_11469:478-1080(-)